MRSTTYFRNYKKILKLGLPILVGQLGMIAVGFADNIMVGRYATSALASASFVNNLFNMAILCAMGFSLGLTPIIGALYARGQKIRCGMMTRVAMRVNILYSLAIMTIMTVVYLNVGRLGQPENLLPIIRPYFLIYLLGMFPLAIANVLVQWCFGIGDTLRPMLVILVVNLVNVLGNWLLIFGEFGLPSLGLTGAGLSTLFARTLMAVLMVFLFAKGNRSRAYRKGWALAARTGYGRMKAQVTEIWRTSFPVSLQMTCETGSFSIAAVLVGLLGEVPLAAFQIIVITGTLGFCVYYSAGTAVSVLVSNRAGMGDRAGMREVAWAGYHILLAMCMISSLVFWIWGGDLMALFSDDPRVVGLAVSLLVPLLLYQVADATQINFANALRGTSKVNPMIWIAVVSYMVVGVPSTYLLEFTFGLETYGVVLSFSVSLLMAAILYLVYFLKATRRSKTC